MTPRPKTIAAEDLATAALAKMEELKITSLVVVDPEQAIVGVDPHPRPLAHPDVLARTSRHLRGITPSARRFAYL